jgi:hypothetical protein
VGGGGGGEVGETNEVEACALGPETKNNVALKGCMVGHNDCLPISQLCFCFTCTVSIHPTAGSFLLPC